MKNIFCKFLSTLLALIMLISVCSVLSLEVFALNETDYGNYGGTIYYVDNVLGNDNNDGTSEINAWKSLDKVNSVQYAPGDQILFKSGGVWNGRVLPQGSGEEGKPIIIGKYGGDALPIINGASAFYDGFFEGSTILLYNQEYYEIYDLSITNKPNQSMASCFGIWVVAEDFGVADHYVIERCYFSKITTNTRSSINNILKYSMKNTRVFITASESDSDVVIEFKNIASYPMNFSSDEIVGRFVRGDESRTAEGNGLGLAIAKSYTEICDGKFEVIVDGDMFKTILKFRKYN